tara:strand:+ start:473 stop:673 length:201 start_codon:yes stop_codon:yes gene_type:complete
MVDLFSVNKFYRGPAVRNNKKKTKIEWKKPVVKTYGDAVDVIKGVCDNKELDSGDGCFLGDDTIGT